MNIKQELKIALIILYVKDWLVSWQPLKTFYGVWPLISPLPAAQEFPPMGDTNKDLTLLKLYSLQLSPFRGKYPDLSGQKGRIGQLISIYFQVI